MLLNLTTVNVGFMCMQVREKIMSSHPVGQHIEVFSCPTKILFAQKAQIVHALSSTSKSFTG